MNHLIQTEFPPDSLHADDSSYQDFFHQQGSRILFPVGTQLTMQDAPVSNVYLIRQGLVKLTRVDAQGHEIIHSLRSSDWIIGGWPALLKKDSPLTAETLTKCLVDSMPSIDFCRVAEKSPTFTYSLLLSFCRESYDDIARQSQLSLPAARTRLLQFLCQFVDEGITLNSGEIQLHIPLNEHEIACYLAVHQSTLSKLYKGLCDEGVIRRHKGRTVIRKTSLLQKYYDPINMAWKLRGGHSPIS